MSTPDPTTGPRCLTVAQAATYLSLSPQTLDSWRCLQRGPRFWKFGRAVRYDKADLDAWLTAHRVAMPGQDAAA